MCLLIRDLQNSTGTHGKLLRMSLGMLLVSFPQVLSKVVLVCLSGHVSIPGEAEGHPAVSVRWIPQAQREGVGREGRGVSTTNLRALFKTGQRETEPNGEPSVALAEVRLFLLSVYLSNPL